MFLTASPSPADIPPAPFDEREFAELMAVCGPFAQPPALAVAVSGGSDSLALCLLADRWARRRGGAVVALTVDHGLRARSAAEARQVGRWLAARDIRSVVLRWVGAKPGRGVQAAAREARHRLLHDWCRRHRRFHLLLAHTAGDQAETVTMRRDHGSGPDGLAAMALVRESDAVRVLRPVLGVPRDRLRATLAAWRQPWLDDPSNRNPAFERVRVRAALAARGAGAVGVEAHRAAAAGAARAARDAAAAELAARSVVLDPAGFCVLDPAPLAAAPPELAARCLAAVLACIGGRAYPAAPAALAALVDSLRAGGLAGRTLDGCRIVGRAGQLVVCREAARCAPAMALRPGAEARWDDRFAVCLAGDAGAGEWTVGSLAACREPRPADLAGSPRWRAIPGPAREALPAVCRDGRLVAVPQTGYATVPAAIVSRFAPRHPLAGPPFLPVPFLPVVSAARDIILLTWTEGGGPSVAVGARKKVCGE